MPKVRKAERGSLTPEQGTGACAGNRGPPYAVAYHLMFTLGLRLGEALWCRNRLQRRFYRGAYPASRRLPHARDERPKRGSAPVARAAALNAAAPNGSARGMTWRGCCARAESGKVIQPSNF